MLALSKLACAEGPSCPSQPIRLAFYEFGTFYSQGRGYDKDVVDELIRRSGCRFDTSVMPRVRIWADIAAGSLDMTTSGVQSSERDHFAWFANYIAVKNYLLLSSSVPKRVNSIDAFVAQPGLRLGIVRGYIYEATYQHWIDRQRAQDRLEEATDTNQLFVMFKAKRFDALLAPAIVYRYAIPDLSNNTQVRVENWLPEGVGVEGGLVLSKKTFTQAEAAKWQMLIKDMHDDGTLNRLLLHYLPADETSDALKF